MGEAVAGGCAANPGTFCGDVAPEGRWISAGPPYAPVGYWKDAAGEVHLQGTIAGSFGIAPLLSEFFYLPPGYRPNGERNFLLVNCADGNLFPVEVLPSGLVQLRTFDDNICPSFDGVSFRP